MNIGHGCRNLQPRSHLEGQQQLIVNEADIYLSCRYVSLPEVIWWTHERRFFHRSHTVERLPIPLHEEQTVYFQAGYDADANLDRDSKLTSFFELCNENIIAQKYFYLEVLQYFVRLKGEWNIRKKNTKFFGLICTVNPTDIKRYYHRVLLLNVKAPQSFDDLRTVNRVLCNSFQEDTEKLNFVINEVEWKECFQEATTYQMAIQLRRLFDIICVFCSPANISHLCTTF